jgi:hypothetical protein
MKLCPSCGLPLEVTISEGDRYTWKTERCISAGCGYLWTFADYGILDLGMVDAVQPLPAFPFKFEEFTEMPEGWKPCIQIECEPLP